MDNDKAKIAALAQAIDLGLVRREDISTTQIPTRGGQRSSSRIAFNPNRNFSNKAQSKAAKDNVVGRSSTRGVGSGAWKDFTAPVDEDAAQLDDLSGGQSHRRGANYAPRPYKVDTKKPNQFEDRTSFQIHDQAKTRKSEAVDTKKPGLQEKPSVSMVHATPAQSETQKADMMKQKPHPIQDSPKISAPARGSGSHYEGAKENVRRMRLHQKEMAARKAMPIVHTQKEVEDVVKQGNLLTDTDTGMNDLCNGMSRISVDDRDEVTQDKLIRSELLEVFRSVALGPSMAIMPPMSKLMEFDVSGPPASSMADMAPLPQLGFLTSSRWA